MSYDCSMSEPYALQVLGDSMEPEFPDRCIVLVDPVDACGDGAFVFAEVEGVRWFRQLREDGNGHRKLVALNGLYPAIDLAGLDYRIVGVIVQRNIRRKIKHYRHRPQQAPQPSPI